MKKLLPSSIAFLILLVLLHDRVQMMLPHLLLGWMDFIQRNVQQMRMRWEVIWSVLGYMAILVIGGHHFARWLLKHLNGGVWKWSWSLRAFAVFVLMFVAGTSAVAVVRQTEWLIRSERPMFAYTSCSSHLRQIGQMLLLYQLDHNGRYPDDLAELLLEPDYDPEAFCCPATHDLPAMGSTRQEMAENARKKGHYSYIYFCRGRVDPITADDVMVCEDTNHHGGGMNILCGDGHVEWVNEFEAPKLLARLTTTRPAQ